jgi:hypothetical protein
MNFCKLAGILSVCLLAAFTSSLLAQSVITPGELSRPSNGASMQLSFETGGSTSNVVPKTNIASVDDPHEKHVRIIWIASIFAMTAGTAADAASSWHRRESNSLLASSDGTFGGKGLAIKGGISAAMLAPQLIFRKHNDWHTAFAVGNFAEAGIYTGTTIHNLNTNSPAK